jgi:Flp pilus assembly protein TadG
MSVFLLSGIAALAYIGVFDFSNFLTMPNSVNASAFVVVFLALFLFVFFLVNLKRGSSKKKKTVAAAAAATAAVVAAGEPAGVTRHQGGLLAAASTYQRCDLSGLAGIDETSGIDVIYEENGVPYINSDLARRNNQGTLNRNFIKLVESVTGSS